MDLWNFTKKIELIFLGVFIFNYLAVVFIRLEIIEYDLSTIMTHLVCLPFYLTFVLSIIVNIKTIFSFTKTIEMFLRVKLWPFVAFCLTFPLYFDNKLDLLGGNEQNYIMWFYGYTIAMMFVVKRDLRDAEKLN